MSKIEHSIDFLFKVCYNSIMTSTSYQRATEKTRSKIRKAFADLLAERGSVNNITITDLAARAEITRGTFYNHYNNLYEVGAELQAEIEKQLFTEYSNFKTSDDIEKYIDKIFTFLKQQETIYRQLLASDAPLAFLSQLENGIIQHVLAMIQRTGSDGANDKNIEFELLILTSGTFAIIRKYYRNEVSASLDEIHDYLSIKLRALFNQYK